MNNTIGLILNERKLYQWQLDCINLLLKNNDCEVQLFTLPTPPSPTTTPAILALYLKFESMVQRVDRHPLALVSLPTAFKPLCQDICLDIPHETPFAAVINFTDNNFDTLFTSETGVWHVNNHASKSRSYPLPGFSQFIKKEPTTGFSLYASCGNSRVALYSSTSQTNWYYFNRNACNAFSKIAISLYNKITYLTAVGSSQFLSNHQTEPNIHYNTIQAYPGTVSLAFLLAKHVYFYVKNKLWHIFYYHQWSILFRISPDEEPLALSNFTTITPPADRFWADPFVIHKDDWYYIFLEELPFHKPKGFLSYIPVDKHGNVGELKKFMEHDYHLSYPNVFSHKNEIFLLPETSGNNTIELYKATSFPDSWELVTVLMNNIKATDSTLLFHDKRWWLFANVKQTKDSSSLDDLCVFYADDFCSRAWTPHPMNPIVSDVTLSRPAGKIFIRNGTIYRPSQDSSYRYGRAVNINVITQLSTDTYSETLLYTIEPNWSDKVHGIHTLNCDEGCTVIDAEIIRSKFFN